MRSPVPPAPPSAPPFFPAPVPATAPTAAASGAGPVLVAPDAVPGRHGPVALLSRSARDGECVLPRRFRVATCTGAVRRRWTSRGE